MPKTIRIKFPTIKIELTPHLYFRDAKDYFDTANLIQKRKKFSILPYFLYCKSIELTLKAYLNSKGTPKEELKSKYGHNIKKLLSTTKKLLSKNKKLFDTIDEKNIQTASNLYDRGLKAFEYARIEDAVIAYKNFPNLMQLKKDTQKILTLKNYVRTQN